jgi:hypothetical protein
MTIFALRVFPSGSWSSDKRFGAPDLFGNIMFGLDKVGVLVRIPCGVVQSICQEILFYQLVILMRIPPCFVELTGEEFRLYHFVAQ